MARKRRKQQKTKEKKKPGVSGERFRKSPAFKNSRRAASEFGRASQCAVLIRRELAQLLELPRENELHLKLSQCIGRLSRKKQLPGEASAGLNDWPWEQMEDFQFNEEASLGNLAYGKPAVSFTRATGEINITWPRFELKSKFDKYKSATHGRIIAGAAAIDFDKKKAVSDYTATDHLPIIRPVEDDRPEVVVNLSLKLPTPVLHPLFIVLGFTCYKLDSNQFYKLDNRRYKALALISVQPAPPPARKVKPPTATKPTTKAVKKKKDR